MAAVLSILIPTLRSRRDWLARLMERLEPQLDDRAIIVALEDEGEKTIGGKRDILVREAQTPFVAFFDDDDLPSVDYFSQIMGAIDQGADVVGFCMRCFSDGVLTGLAIHSLSAKCWSMYQEEDGLYHYLRTPNHLNPVRTELAQAIGYRPLNTGEDADYSRRLYARFGQTMREVFIDRYLYEYWYRKRIPRPPTIWDEDGRLTRAGAQQAIAEGGSVMFNGRMCFKIEDLDQAEAG